MVSHALKCTPFSYAPPNRTGGDPRLQLALLSKHGTDGHHCAAAFQEVIARHEKINLSLNAYFKVVKGCFMDDNALQLSIK